MHSLAFALAIVLTGISNTALRFGARDGGSARKSLLGKWTIFGYGLFGVVTLLSVYAAQVIPLRTLTAWSSLSNVATIAFATVALKERLDRRIIFSTSLVTTGLVIYSFG